MQNPHSWLALVIGNSRLHWAWFDNFTLQRTWDTPHLSASAVAPLTHYPDFSRILGELHPLFPSQAQLPLWVASVVPAQAEIWQAYCKTHLLTLDQIPLQGLYPTLGVDRALALWGAIHLIQRPVLVVDAGTALTLTAADVTGQLIGGAILPGLGLQLRSLHQYTAALPDIDPRLITTLPSVEASPRWATQTSDAMISGVLYTLIAGLQDFAVAWWRQFPQGAVVITGGDRLVLYRFWQQQFPQQAGRVKIDANLVFWGIQAIVEGKE